MLGKNFMFNSGFLSSRLGTVSKGLTKVTLHRDWKVLACLGALGIFVNVGIIGQVQAADVVSNTKNSQLNVSDSQKTTGVYSLDFNSNTYELREATVNGQTISYRAYENIPYVAKPVDIEYQYMNIYIPEAYFENDAQGKYTKETAPIFFPNSVGGYRPSKAATPTVDASGNPNATMYALSKGLVVAAPATRGRSNEAADGTYIGKAPAVIVDLKAAVAYLHSNDARMPGNANRIISNGTSAGGAVSLLLGATGHALDYNSYLQELGVASYDTDIYAVSAYCPITDLDHADMAYEWSYNGVNEYTGMGGFPGQQEPPDPTLGSTNSDSENSGEVNGESNNLDANESPNPVLGVNEPPNPVLGATNAPQGTPNGHAKTIPLTADAIAYSKILKDNFPNYFNSLSLKATDGTDLTLDNNGTGTFMKYAKSFIIASANKAKAEGTDISGADYLICDSMDNGHIVDIDWTKYNAAVGRMKAPGAFDARDNSTGENNLFGTQTVDNQHFTTIASIQGDGTPMADFQTIKMMNPLYYINSVKSNGFNYNQKTAKYWRIRYGEHDNNTSMAVPLIVATRLQNYGYSVDFAMPWGVGHAGDYDLEELFQWIDSIV